MLNDKVLRKLIETGIPVSAAHFQNAVNNGDQVPENFFSMDSQNPSRRVEMWLTMAQVLVYSHKGKYLWTPNANVKFGQFTNAETT